MSENTGFGERFIAKEQTRLETLQAKVNATATVLKHREKIVTELEEKLGGAKERRILSLRLAQVAREKLELKEKLVEWLTK